MYICVYVKARHCVFALDRDIYIYIYIYICIYMYICVYVKARHCVLELDRDAKTLTCIAGSRWVVYPAELVSHPCANNSTCMYVCMYVYVYMLVVSTAEVVSHPCANNSTCMYVSIRVCMYVILRMDDRRTYMYVCTCTLIRGSCGICPHP